MKVPARDTNCIYCRRNFDYSLKSHAAIVSWKYIVNDVSLASETQHQPLLRFGIDNCTYQYPVFGFTKLTNLQIMHFVSKSF